MFSLSLTMSRLLLTFYGDDFTGSTDALEQLALAGLRAALFVEPPTPAQLKNYPGLQAVGVAGMTRSLAPAAMERELRPALKKLKALGAPHVHYKVCSTFDSSPTIGSIGRVIDVAARIFTRRSFRCSSRRRRWDAIACSAICSREWASAAAAQLIGSIDIRR